MFFDALKVGIVSGLIVFQFFQLLLATPVDIPNDSPYGKKQQLRSGLTHKLLSRVYGQEKASIRLLAISYLTTLVLVAAIYLSFELGASGSTARLAGTPDFWTTIKFTLGLPAFGPGLFCIFMARYFAFRNSDQSSLILRITLLSLCAVFCAGLSYLAIRYWCHEVDFYPPTIPEVVLFYSFFSLFFYASLFPIFAAISIEMGSIVFGLRQRLFPGSHGLVTSDPGKQVAFSSALAAGLCAFVISFPAILALGSKPGELNAFCSFGSGSLCSHLTTNETPIQERYDLLFHGCRRGDPRSCSALGDMYAEGIWVDTNPEIAAELMATACTRSGSIGCNGLAHLHLRNDWEAAEQTEAKVLYEQQCLRDNFYSCERLAWLTLASSDEAPNPGAMDLLDSSCLAGRLRACVFAAELKRAGWQQAPDTDKAYWIVKDACEQGGATACLQLSQYLLDDTIGPSSQEGAADEAMKACRLELRSGCVQYAEIVLQSGEDHIDRGRATKILDEACKDNFQAACYVLFLRTNSIRKGSPLTVVETQKLGEFCRLDRVSNACLVSAQSQIEKGDTSGALSFAKFACQMGEDRGCIWAFEILASNRHIFRDDPEAIFEAIDLGCRPGRREACLFTSSGVSANVRQAAIVEIVRTGQTNRLRDASNRASSAFPYSVEAKLNSILLDDPGLLTDEVASKIIELPLEFPDDPRAYMAAAQASSFMGDFAGTVKLANRGLRIDRLNTNLLWLKADAHEKLGQVETAISTYVFALDQGASSLIILNNYASLVLTYSTDVGHFDRAQLFLSILEEHDVPQLIETVAWGKVLAGEVEAGLHLLLEVETHFRADPIVSSHIGLALHWNGQSTKARSYLEFAERNLREWERRPLELVAQALQEL